MFQSFGDLGENYWNLWLVLVHEEVSPVCDKYMNKTKLMWFYKAEFNLLEIPRLYHFGMLNIVPF